MTGVAVLESGGAAASSHTQPCPGPGKWQGCRGGKGHDVHTGMTHNIVAKQECDISVSHLYKWALRVVNRYGVQHSAAFTKRDEEPPLHH